jgi:glyoxylase-like metal-dependent hydrolase (beta-lactamase superfamily II)
MNGETVSLVHVPPAHTDSDIYIHFEKANVLQTGDIFFNGFYPYIDGGTGGSLAGMIAGATKLLAVAGNDTKIVPGHGPLGNKAELLKYRDMLSAARDKIMPLKSSGKSVEEAIAAKPLADLDAAWGKGLFTSDAFVRIVYSAS